MPESGHRRRALLITRNLPPLRGGMERLNLQVSLALSEACDVSVCGPEGCAAHLESAADVVEVPHRPLPLFLLCSLAGSFRLAWRRRPDVVIAGSGLTAPIAWLIARLCAARFVVYLHGLDLVAASRIYQLLWLPVIRRADIALANSRHTASLAQQRGLPIGKVSILHPGTVLPLPDQSARQRFRETNNLGERPLLLSVGRLTPRKGLAEFIERALPGIVEACPGAQLLVIGDDAIDAVRATRASERSRIQQAAEDAGMLGSVRFMPSCDEAALADAYLAADVYVFPVREIAGDIEGFGMVAIEAAAHGLSTVAFRVGGVADAVMEGRSGELVAQGDYAGFGDAVVRMLRPATGAALRSAECRSAAAAFGWDRFGSRLRALLSLEPPDTQDRGGAA